MLGQEVVREPDGIIEYVTSPMQLQHVRNWSYNRPPDDIRVQEIIQSGRIDGIIYVAELSASGQSSEVRYVCYDGNHRREAYNQGMPSVNGILVRVMTNATHNMITTHFTQLNKSIPVPSLYMESDFDPEIYISITETVKKLARTYSSFNKSSVHCKRPNFNRDVLAQELTVMIQHGQVSHEGLLQYLLSFNQNLCERREELRSEMLENAFKKCDKSNFFLFYKKPYPFGIYSK